MEKQLRKLKSIEKIFDVTLLGIHGRVNLTTLLDQVIKNAREYFGLVPEGLDFAEVHIKGENPYKSPVILFRKINEGKGNYLMAFASKMPDREGYRLDAYEEL